MCSPMPLLCGKDPHAGERLFQLRKRRHAPLNPAFVHVGDEKLATRLLFRPQALVKKSVSSQSMRVRVTLGAHFRRASRLSSSSSGC